MCGLQRWRGGNKRPGTVTDRQVSIQTGLAAGRCNTTNLEFARLGAEDSCALFTEDKNSQSWLALRRLPEGRDAEYR